MKSERGVTLTSLVIYIIIATILIMSISLFSSFFFSNMNLIKDQDRYAAEFNKFAMFFIKDVKDNSKAVIADNKTEITLENGAKYQYKPNERAIYRGDVKVAERVDLVEFSSDEVTIKNTTKQIIKVKISVGDKTKFSKEMEFVMKYW